MEKQMPSGGVTCILTSCGRFDLLRITLESFFKYNTYPIKEFYIYEDSLLSGKSFTQNNPQIEIGYLKSEFPFIAWVIPGEPTGQIAALDYLWTFCVDTPYAFTMEDDWEFLEPSFIEASLPILEKHKEVLQVWLNPLEPQNVHPVDWSNIDYGLLSSSGNIWSGTRFNPALKRKSDYDLIAPFSKHTTWNPAKPWKCEADISKVYHKLGFKGAILPKQYIKHIGEGRHI